jgi:hypothetical protein
MTRHLAESENYKVTSEYESVTLHFKNKLFNKTLYIGDFYGDPDCAIISRDEKYVVMAGCGLIIYKLQEPFDEYGSDDSSGQYFEFYRDPPNNWWTNGLHQTQVDADWKYFRFVAANDEGEFIYKMDTTTFEIEQISTVPNNGLAPGGTESIKN